MCLIDIPQPARREGDFERVLGVGWDLSKSREGDFVDQNSKV